MTDLENFKAMLDGTKNQIPYEQQSGGRSENEDDNSEYSDVGDTVIKVWSGYHAHFEATFDATGKLKNIGQWDEM